MSHPDDAVNEFLERAIDARSVDQLKRENLRPIFLKFYKKDFEDKVSIKMYKACTIFTYSCI